jgi:putative mycofactocin binding protein MftB
VSTNAGGPGGPSHLAGNAGGAAGFDLDRPWQVDDRVAVRPEPFGALLYHFGTRRLSFLKNTTVVAVVRSLAEHPSARSACAAAGVGTAALPAYERALATLAESQMIRERGVAATERCALPTERGALPTERDALATEGAAS